MNNNNDNNSNKNDDFKEYMKRIGVNVRVEVVIQKTALSRKAKILRKVLSL